MSELTSEHIAYITRDLTERGLLLDGLREELIDHICAAVEREMQGGKRFIEAYAVVVRAFGDTTGIQKTQYHTLKFANKKPNSMIRNYLTIAWRNLNRQGIYSLINVTGLAVGIAVCLLIVLYVKDELSYDRFNTKGDRIYRVENEIQFGSNYAKVARSSPPVANTLMHEYPEIEATVRFVTLGSYLVNAGNGKESIKEENVIWADSSFFNIFSVNVLEGDKRTALKELNSVAISKKAADKYFPEGNAIGKTLILDNVRHAKVSAVFETLPSNSHLHFDFLISMYGDWPIARQASSQVFDGNNYATYLLLRENSNPDNLTAKLPAFVEKYIMKGSSSPDKKFVMLLRPLYDIHLHSDASGELEPNGSIVYVYLFETTALLIFVVACINFMNMSTAKSSNRAKEVGVRKAMGSMRSHLIRQFLTESALVTAFAFILAIGLAFLALPFFNGLSGKQLSMPFDDLLFYGAAICGIIGVSFVAGIYPSFYLSAFKPANVLKGRASLGAKSNFVRSTLVVFQFMISIFLIVGAITINRQLDFIQSKKLGFEKDQLLVVEDAYMLRPNVQSFKNQVLTVPSVSDCSVTGYIPIEIVNAGRNDRTFWKEGEEAASSNLVSLQTWFVDFDYIKTMGMSISEGRSFAPEYPSDTRAIILNQTAVARFGLGTDPVGKRINTFTLTGGAPDFAHPEFYTVIGVVNDFHFSSMKSSISPLGFFLGETDGFVLVKFQGDKAKETIQSIKKIWKGIAPTEPFEYSFVEDDFAKMYASEERLGAIFTWSASLSIFIACFGLFALTAFMAEQRTREIGIRKVLGASVGNIVYLLSKDLSRLVVIAFILVIPIAWYTVHSWLESYTYKTEVGVLVYVVAGLLAFVIAFVPLGSQSIKAASSNPVDSLRGE